MLACVGRPVHDDLSPSVRTVPPAMRDDIAFIALGSNLGDREQHLADARARIAAMPGVALLSASRVEETAPIGPPGQGPYLNQMVAVRTTLLPPALLAALQAIEAQGGRVRTARWGARTIDLDIVRYEQTTWQTPTLMVPHPELPNRVFWQRELDELLARLGLSHHAASSTPPPGSPGFPQTSHE